MTLLCYIHNHRPTFHEESEPWKLFQWVAFALATEKN